MASEHRIHSISFEGDVVVIAYFTSTDVRVGGRVGLMHQAQISMGHPDYAEDAELLERSAARLLKNALADWSESDPWDPSEEDDPDDEAEFGSRHA